VTVAEETAGANEDERIAKADQLSIIGTDDWALEELGAAAAAAPASPRVNLAIARIYRARNDNVQALNILKRSYPDYSQMKPEEMRRDEWTFFIRWLTGTSLRSRRAHVRSIHIKLPA